MDTFQDFITLTLFVIQSRKVKEYRVTFYEHSGEIISEQSVVNNSSHLQLQMLLSA